MNLRKKFLNGILSLTFVYNNLAMGQTVIETTAAKCSGVWSASSTVVTDIDSPSKEIPSVNGKMRIKVIDGALWFEKDRGQRWPLDVFLNPPHTELIWASDSSKFAVNTSDGGGLGSWDFSIFSARSNGPKKINFYAAVHGLADHFPHCEEKEVPNFAAVAWIHEDKEILLVAEVPPHSSCSNMGAVVGYRLSANTGRVLEQLPQERLLKEFGSLLGCRIRQDR
jgi:hypothetical protein